MKCSVATLGRPPAAATRVGAASPATPPTLLHAPVPARCTRLTPEDL